MTDFSSKVALVTGGTRGLGRAIALRLARGGAALTLNYRRDEESAGRTLAEVRAMAPRSILVKADMESDSEVRAMVERAGEVFGRLDFLIVNAAATAFKPLLEVKPHNLARTFNLSVGGFVAAVQAASRFFSAGGRIVIISGVDSIRYMPGHGVLGAAKSALESMVRDFAFELGPRGVTVNGVNFGLVDSDSSRLYLGADFERASEAAISRSALGRLPQLEDLAAAVTLLLQPEAGFITAQTIMVDGGLALASPFAR
ncbi:MAG TPA: SDR family oxidoreductase [Candidatus Binataceae bacterium]|nr:SDR family oxidoreductase [Candidatus Binataceae bacterium]